MLDNNEPPETLPKKPPNEEDSDEAEQRFKLTKMMEILLHNGATTADIILNLSYSAIATTINIADLVNQITAGNAQSSSSGSSSSSSSSNEVSNIRPAPPESPDELPAPTEDEEEAEEEEKQKIYNI